MDRDELIELIRERFPDATNREIENFAQGEFAGMSEDEIVQAFERMREFEEMRDPTELEPTDPGATQGYAAAGMYSWAQRVNAIDEMGQTPAGDFQPYIDDRTGEVVDTRYIRVPQLGLIRMEEYLTRWLQNDPLIAHHEAQLARDIQTGSAQALHDSNAIAEAQMQYLDMPLQPDLDNLRRQLFETEAYRQNEQYLGFGVNPTVPGPHPIYEDQQIGPGRIAQMPDGGSQMGTAGGASPLGSPTADQMEFIRNNRTRYTYAWGAMSPTRMRTWLNSQTPEVVGEFQLLVSAMGIVDDPQAVLSELGRGPGAATMGALEAFGQQMWQRREQQTLNQFISEQIDANFNQAASQVVSNRALANLDEALGADDAGTGPVITLSTTKPEDMEDQLRDMVGELFGERQALSQEAITEIVQGGLAREREAALQGSAQYQQALLDAERKANENPSFEDATIAAFLDATYTGFGSGAQQYMGMTAGMYENLAGMIGVTDISQITPEEEQVVAKLWAETMISQAGGNIPQALTNANISQLQGRTLDATQSYDPASGAGDPTGQGIRGSVPGLYSQGVVGSSSDLVPEQMGKFNDSIEAMTGLSYVDLVAGNYNTGTSGSAPPIVIDAPRFDMVRYLRRAAINANPQKFAKADMRRRMQTWINDLIVAESPARMG